MDEKTARLVIELIPVALTLTEKVIEAAKQVKKAGYAIASEDELRAKNNELRALPNL